MTTLDGPDQQLGRPGLDEGDAAGPLHGAMTGHTLYVIPYSMGARRLAHIANIGVELTGPPSLSPTCM